jgi:hypothetical protein
MKYNSLRSGSKVGLYSPLLVETLPGAMMVGSGCPSAEEMQAKAVKATGATAVARWNAILVMGSLSNEPASEMLRSCVFPFRLGSMPLSGSAAICWRRLVMPDAV